MTLVKLDSGDYINTDAVDVIKDGDNPYIGLRSNNSFDITTADRDRIVEAMGGEYTEDKSITMKLDHNLASEVTKVVGREISRKQMGLAH